MATWRRTILWAVTTAVVTTVLILAGLWGVDRYVAAPRSDRVEVAAEKARVAAAQSQLIAEHQCEFFLATARALHALSSNQDLSDRQQQRLDEMVAKARHCNPTPPGHP